MGSQDIEKYSDSSLLKRLIVLVRLGQVGSCVPFIILRAENVTFNKGSGSFPTTFMLKGIGYKKLIIRKRRTNDTEVVLTTKSNIKNNKRIEK